MISIIVNHGSQIQELLLAEESQ